MKTVILKINPFCIEQDYIIKAANIIRVGGLVAFPTETVYGLGADALNPVACAKIFQAKNRPLEDPLIVHIADKQDLFKVAREVYRVTLDLIDEFWPGPLTLVLKKQEVIPDIVTAGFDTVAVRMPAHEIALRLINASGTPIAAPSANLFGRTSPTTAQHVLEDLDGKIDLVIDGESSDIVQQALRACWVGVESTIVDLTQDPFCVLRPGGVGIEELRRIIPQVGLYNKDGILSAGMYPRHYSPRAKVMLVEERGQAEIEKVRYLVNEFNNQGYRTAIIAKEENRNKYAGFNVESIGPGDNLAVCAANLFSVLRGFDKENVEIIIAESVNEEGLGRAIMDRLRRAAYSVVYFGNAGEPYMERWR